jgi:aryl-alcohol dehydrogenase-like predicted oxidoreductase
VQIADKLNTKQPYYYAMPDKIIAMEKRRLGHSGLVFAPLVLGGNVFGWTIDEPTSFAVLDHFTASGCSLIDTADMYSNWKPGNKGGESETILGNWMKTRKNRQTILIATKVGGDMGQGKNLRKKYILQAAAASLKRLQTDYIDLYQSHWDDLNTPVDETLEAYAQLVAEGKVRVIGASNFSRARLSESLNNSRETNRPRYESLQPRYNLYDREEFEQGLQAYCLEEQLGVIPYYGLASGFLSGKYRTENDLSKSARGGGVQKFMTARGFRILEALDQVAQGYSVPPATIALAWLMAQPAITAPIASATSIRQLNELLQAVSIQLDAQALKELNEASAY